MHNKEAR